MNEQELRTLLIQATEDRPAGIDLMPALPARRRSRVLVPAITGLGVAAAAAAILLALPVNQPSAQAQVAAAIENTGDESFRIHVEAGAKTFDGAVDPTRRVAVITQADGSETRFVGDQMYIKDGQNGKWMVEPRFDGNVKGEPASVIVVKLAAIDPQQALERLRSATDVKQSGAASGTGWTGQRFTFSLKDEAMDASGSLDVDDEGRVRRLEMTFSDNGQRDVMDFTDFGTEVTVTAPPADQVEQAPIVEKKD